MLLLGYRPRLVFAIDIQQKRQKQNMKIMIIVIMMIVIVRVIILLNNFYTNSYQFQQAISMAMRRIAKPGWCSKEQNEQQNQSQGLASVKQDCNCISGWDDDRILLQRNPNISKPKAKQLNLSSTSNENDNNAIDHSILENVHARTSHQRKRTTKKPSTTSHALIECTNTNNNAYINTNNTNINMNMEGQHSSSQPTQTNECTNYAMKYEMSNIELLKFQAKHLADDEVTNYRLPNFAQHQSQILHNPEHAQYLNLKEQSSNICNNRSAQLDTSMLYSVGRKLRTESTKRKKESSVSQSSNPAHSALWTNTVSNSNGKMYKTLTKQWISALNKKNPHLIIESFSALSEGQMSVNGSYPHSCASSSVHQQKQKQKQGGISSNPNSNKNTLNTAQDEYPRAIHYKKYRPFTKYFQCKRNRHNEASSLSAHKGPQQNSINNNNNNAQLHGAGNFMKKVEGRKLYQLLSLNRQIIKIEDL